MINIHDPNFNIQRIKFEDMVADAVERGDEEAQAWLTEQMMKTVEVVKDGVTKTKYQSPNQFRVEYLTKFCGYEPKKATQRTAEQKRMDMVKAMFDKARNK